MSRPVDKFLTDAVSAARDRAADGVTDGAATRLRVRESLGHRGVRRKRFTLIAAVIASMFGSTAFAYWAGWRPPWSKPAAVSDAALPSVPDDAAPAKPRPRVAMRTPDAIPDAGVELAPPIEVAPPAPIESAPAPIAPAHIETLPPAPRPRTVPRPRVTAPAPAPVETAPAAEPLPTTAPAPTPDAAPAPTAPPAPQITQQAPRIEAQPDPELASYRQAHDLHFRGRDPQAALAAWDAYLRAYPEGRLVPEARYDRALVLVKLARWAEARAALAPFANAKPGSYRQREAMEILAAIKDR